MGSDSANSESNDLAGNARKNGTIDLGPYEFLSLVTFAVLYPGLDANGDANGNGLSNYYDYAVGGDPTATGELTSVPLLNNNLLTVSYRNDAADVFVEYQKSETLLSNSWGELIESTDYISGSEAVNGSQTQVTFELLTNEPSLFIRQVFSETAP